MPSRWHHYWTVYQKANRNKSQQFDCILFLKIKFSFVHFIISWHLVVKVSALVWLNIGIIIKVSVSKKSKQYTALVISEISTFL